MSPHKVASFRENLSLNDITAKLLSHAIASEKGCKERLVALM